MHKLCLSLLFVIMGCGTLQKWAIRSSSPVFKQTSQDLLLEGNWEFFRASTPGNLKFLELMWHQDKANLILLSVLVKGYAGYAFAVPETLLMGDELAGIDESPWKKETLSFYTRAFDFGLYYLKQKGISRKELLGDETSLKAKLNDELDEDDFAALLYTAQSWGSLINLQKDNMALVSQVPKVKVLFDWVCEKDPSIDQNVCDIFYAQYEASRPKMLGGDPQKAEKLYLAAIKKHPQHLLIRINYLQYLVLPGFDQEKYEIQTLALKTEFKSWEDLNRDELIDRSPYKTAKNLNLYNAIAKKRFELMEKYKSTLF